MELLESLNKEQLEAVKHKSGPLLIVAGAGTGKTTVITQKIAWLIEQGLAKPEEILALTFTEKAAGEMEERVDALLPIGYTDLWISTFHSFGEKILKLHALDIGLSNDFKLLTETGQWLLMRQNFDKFDLDYYKPLGNPAKFIGAMIKHFSRAKDEEITPAEYLEYAENLQLDKDSRTSAETKKIEIKRLQEIAGAYHTYQQLLLDNNALDFGDLINYTLKLFRDRPQILDKYREQFKFILVDEFQDTNYAQYDLVKMLAAPKNNLTVVADDDQSIYRFRGSSINNILEFKSDYPDAKEVVLVENYRSCQNILDLSYTFIQGNNPNRLESKLNELTKEAKKKGIALDKFKTINKKLKATDNCQAPIEHLHAETLEDEVKAVVEKIIEIKTEKPKSLWSDFAILVRANNQANIFLHALERAQIPYQFFAQRGLYTKPVILDVIAYFKLLDNYHESPALFRVLSYPFWKIPAEDLMKLNLYAFKKTKSLYETLQEIQLVKGLQTRTLDIAKKLLGLIERHTQLAKDKNVSELYVTALKDLGYTQYLHLGETESKVEQLSYLQQFYSKIKQFEAQDSAPRLNTFMELLDLEIEAGDEGSLSVDIEAGPEVVKVMTIHASKGLEFEQVFIVNLVDKRFPTIERKDPIELPDELVKELLLPGNVHLQEERRLMYVAMTRARRGLYFTSADDYGGSRKKKISQFLDELGFSNEKKIEVKNGGMREPTAEQAVARMPQAGAAADYSKHHAGCYSYSQLSSFAKCPLQYKFAYILRVPILGKHTFSFGQTMHLTLQRFLNLMIEHSTKQQSSLLPVSSSSAAKDPSPDRHPEHTTSHPELDSGSLSNRDSGTPASAGAGSAGMTKEKGHPDRHPEHTSSRPELDSGSLSNRDSGSKAGMTKKGIPPLKDLLKIYDEAWIGDWYPDKQTKEKYYKQGKESLTNYYKDLAKNPPRPLHLEKDFTLKVGKSTIKGKIDRIDETAEGIEIIDYKTGKPKDPKKLSADDKEQLLIYQLAAKQTLKQEPTNLSYHYLDSGTKVNFLGGEGELKKLEQDLIARIEAIEKSDFKPTPGWACKFCDYNTICEFRQK
ncbi:MAG: hypothetical protein COT81_03940 [Candidatus Buchananbacteria bacterium CG10_big_fil_rev_8_21_14_0_10_42_9]|uniref:DNA 3'-5' helicase n=1 Tax=Candidatus Buchananbacteria bacterium CG10_big_fil_rev_8_21_14_0_10_42_9 TaxID=1974526 RepID=A0A2H0W0S0_9BACT|nr:MAG: hypothetical protein COT81_03940 [Candidatus Buchananbacteria bacterium CG10_big_fil_rev_8_21_14_0_10_42_9]